MRSTTRNLCTFTALAGLSLGGFAAFAQDGAGPGTMDPTKMPPAGNMAGDAKAMAGDMAANMEADKAALAQLMKIAASPEMAGDKLFVLHAGMGNMLEVEYSRMVMEKAQDPQVKDLAKMIMTEHSMNQEKLMPIAQKMMVELPKALPSMKMAELKIKLAMPPAELEKAYLCDMKADHAKTVTMFIDGEKTKKDEQLKAYITESIPALKAHTGMVLKVAVAKGLPGDMIMGGTMPDAAGTGHEGHDMK